MIKPRRIPDADVVRVAQLVGEVRRLERESPLLSWQLAEARRQGLLPVDQT
jgi:hypothetical protein